MPPILLLLFNRPDCTEGLLEILQRVKPSKLYISIDGPRANVPADLSKVQQVHGITRHLVDWKCECFWLINDENLGCGKSVSTALSWFFEHEERGIVLEDDCHPNPSFFDFTSEMLNRYENDHRVGLISGSTMLPPGCATAQPYYFSKYSAIWGWASWRRVWKKYDFMLSDDPCNSWKSIILENNPDELEQKLYFKTFQAIKSNILDTWDYQLQFSLWKHQLASIIPTVNLISNVGFRDDATHTKSNSPLANRSTGALSPPFSSVPFQVSADFDRLAFIFRLYFTPDVLLSLLYESDHGNHFKMREIGLQNEISSLKSQIDKLTCNIQEQIELNSELMNQCKNLKIQFEASQKALQSYYGFSGAWRCFAKRFTSSKGHF